jgi:hypothetical protein
MNGCTLRLLMVACFYHDWFPGLAFWCSLTLCQPGRDGRQACPPMAPDDFQIITLDANLLATSL